MANASVKEIVEKLGGLDNIAAAAHCATRLRVTTKDKTKVDLDGLKKLNGVMGVVDGATQTQIVIGADVADVYREFCDYTGVSEEEEVYDAKALKEDLKGKKGAGLTLFFETVARIFNPIVPALAGCGFLSVPRCNPKHSQPSLLSPWQSSHSFRSCLHLRPQKYSR